MASRSPFTAYFDASGHPSDQPFVVVSGYVANHFQWQIFDTLWTNIHKKYDVQLPFHMAEFMARKRDDYKKWAIDDPKADEFLLELCNAQQVYMLTSVSCIVDMGVYREMNDVFQMDTMLPAFALGARSCVELVEQWQKESDIRYPVECIFEDGDFGRGKFINLMRVERMPAPIFKDKIDFPGLQAADHLAWEQGHYLKKKRIGQHLPGRRSFTLLLTTPHRHIEVHLDTLLNICEKKGVPIKRSNVIIP